MTDVEGSTRRWETHHQAMAWAMARHDELVSEAVGRHGGAVLKDRGEGDSHFAVFKEPKDAAECAVAIQHALSGEGWEAVGPILLRIAIHTGEAELRDSDYYGPAVNRCARLRAAGHGGQILVSHATQRLLRSSGCELKTADLGRHRLKDLLQPERIFQLIAPGLQREFPSLKTLDEVRHNLPVQLSSFVGRQREIEEVKELIFRKRLVTLSGTGGNGKTRLAVQVGAEVVDQFPDGVWFASLVPVKDGASVATQVASDLKIAAGEDPLQTLEAHFETWQALLILDNCEQVLDGASSLARHLLRSCPDLNMVATSREPLAVAGEQVYRTPSLSFKLDSTRPSPEALRCLDAPLLLAERARDRGLDDILTESQAQAIAKLCKRLDGIPLALEQAAANLDLHTPEQLLSKLEQHFAMRGLEDAGVEERHRTVHMTVDWSYHMLPEAERALFGRLAIFVNGWSLDAARAVCSGDGIPEKQVDLLLGNLIRKSLVFVETTPWEDRRFRLLEVVREYAEETGQVNESLAERHHSYYSGLAEESLSQLVGAHQAQWAQVMEAEHDNLRRALAWAQQHGCSLEMAVAMRRFWLRIGFVREGLTALRFAVENERASDFELEGHAFNALGAFAYKLEDLNSAQGYYEESLLRWKQAGRADLEASVLHNLALVAIQRGEDQQALEHLQRSFEMSEAEGHESQAAGTLLSMGGFRLQFGDYRLAETYLTDAVARFRKLGDSYNLAVALGRLADARFSLGSTRTGASDFLDALRIWAGVHDPYALGTALLCLSEIGLGRKDLPAAIFFYESAQVLLLHAEATLDEYLAERQGRLAAALESASSRQDREKIKAEAEFASLDHVNHRAQDFCSTLAIDDNVR